MKSVASPNYLCVKNRPNHKIVFLFMTPSFGKYGHIFLRRSEGVWFYPMDVLIVTNHPFKQHM